MKLIGAILIFFGCSFCGFSLAFQRRREIALRRELIGILERIDLQLRYHQNPLPDLCRMVADDAVGPVQTVFYALSAELDRKITVDVKQCMAAALPYAKGMPTSLKLLLMDLGSALGKYDLYGQTQVLETMAADWKEALTALEKDSGDRIRCLQTLGVCTGAALVILLV